MLCEKGIYEEEIKEIFSDCKNLLFEKDSKEV